MGKVKRLAVFALTPLLLGSVLAGCGSSSNAGGGDGKIHLTMASWRVEDADGYKKIIEDFEKKNPDIVIDFKPTKATEYDTTLDTALKGGDAADIIQLRPYRGAAKLADAGYLVPLDDKIKGLSNITPGLVDAAKGSDGKIYGVPLSVNSVQIYYNKKIFQENNLSVPQTWDDLMKICQTLKAKGITPFALGGKDGWILSLTHGALGPDVYGGTQFVNDFLAGKAKFTDPKFVASIQRMKDLAQYFPDNFMGLTANDGMALFFSEKAAMYVGGSFDLQPIRTQNPNLQLGFFPVPPQSGGSPVVSTWVDGSYGVNAKSPHVDAALKFLEYMTTKEFGQLFADTFGRVAAVQGVEPSDPIVKQMAETDSKYGTPYMMVIYMTGGDPTTTKKTFENELQGMYLNQESPQDVARKVQESADSWFKPQK
jgi:raffinose/stachyose/melibiose transport system substrate-binding protein